MQRVNRVLAALLFALGCVHNFVAAHPPECAWTGRKTIAGPVRFITTGQQRLWSWEFFGDLVPAGGFLA